MGDRTVSPVGLAVEGSQPQDNLEIDVDSHHLF